MAQDNLIGKTINGYEITGIIGRGGMATVYRAHQISMNRAVAMKVLPRQFVDDDTYIQRFKREVDIVARLEHRSIVPVYDYGEQDRQPFIIMRYMPAGSVDVLIRGGAVPMERILEIMTQVAPALDYAHSKNVLHRDLKPSNILMDDGGGAYITDFGIARILGEAAASTITTQGVVGTPAYMSPEQAQGKPLDGRSDIYALGVMLFEMATGRRPFESDTPYGVAVMQVTTPPPQPSSFNPALPKRVEQVIYKALDKLPENRYQTAAELANTLAEAWEQRNTPIIKGDTQPRPILQPHLQPPPLQTAPTITPPPYAPQNPSNPSGSAWIASVEQQPILRKRRRKRTNVLGSLFIGVMIGCVLLTGLVGGFAYLFRGEVLALFGSPPTAPPITPVDSVTPGGITIDDSTPMPTRTPDPITEPAVRVIPSNTPIPTAMIPPTEPAFSPTPTIAPIGVRPDDEASTAPTGEVVYFTETDGNFDLYRLAVANGRVRRLTYGARADQFPAVSPNGEQVAFLAVQSNTWDIHVYNLSTTGVNRITDAGINFHRPAWSPDGAWLVFAADPRADGNTDLFRMRPDGSELHPIFHNGGRNTAPSWHGERIAFATGERDDARTWEIALLDMTNNDFTRLTDNAVKDWDPSWSPNGDYILYHTEGEGGARIVAMDMIGNNGVIPIYDGPGYEWGARYSPDGRFIIFSSDAAGRDQLYLFNGQEAEPITENGGFPADWVPYG